VEDDSASVVTFMAAVFRTRDVLRDHAARVWVEGSYEYVVSGRQSKFHGSHWEHDDLSLLRIGEEIVLDGTRTLDFGIDIRFTRALTVSGFIVLSWEVPEGFDEQEILTLPKRATSSVAEFTTLLEDYASQICADPHILDGIAVPKR
jgi:hypothetical protein